MIIKIKNEELSMLNNIAAPSFPKYTAQLINLASQNAQATRPKVVGNLSELFPEFKNQATDITVNDWQTWYISNNPQAITESTKKICLQLKNLEKALSCIDEEMVKTWVTDLIINKTYNGLYLQQAILQKLSIIYNTTYRLATAKEEAKGIDGYVGKIAYSIKPITYKATNVRSISDDIDVKMIFYKKQNSNIIFEIED